MFYNYIDSRQHTYLSLIHISDKIFDRIWGENKFEVDNTVMVHIRNLRDKIEDDNKKPKYIKTVWGVGYKFGE